MVGCLLFDVIVCNVVLGVEFVVGCWVFVDVYVWVVVWLCWVGEKFLVRCVGGGVGWVGRFLVVCVGDLSLIKFFLRYWLID